MNTVHLLPSKEYWAQGQWNKERLKERWTGKDAHHYPTYFSARKSHSNPKVIQVYLIHRSWKKSLHCQSSQNFPIPVFTCLLCPPSCIFICFLPPLSFIKSFSCMSIPNGTNILAVDIILLMLQILCPSSQYA